MRYTDHFSYRNTPQNQPIPGSSQVQNNAGGFAWKIDDWGRLKRFFILGTEGGTYYTSECDLTIHAADAVLRCIEADGIRVVNEVVEISEAGRATKNEPAIFVLALAAAAKDEGVRKAALASLPKVARTSTHLFKFVDYVKEFRGWGRALRRAIGDWYGTKDANSLAYQIVKYRQRGGWTHRDILRLASPIPPSKSHAAIYRWIVSKNNFGERKVWRKNAERADVYPPVDRGDLPEIISVFEELEQAGRESDELRIVDIIRKNKWVTWEMIPSNMLGSPIVWKNLVTNLPITALIRNLGRISAIGIFSDREYVDLVVEKLTNSALLRKARIHPIQVLTALATYSSGSGMRGSLTWKVSEDIVNALDKAFYISFGSVEPTGKRFVLGIDVSGSMDYNMVGSISISARQAAAAMAMVTVAVENNCHVMAFSHKFVPVEVSPDRSLNEICYDFGRMPFGATDCALPMLWALEKGIMADGFVIYTDNETWVGKIHPTQALEKYRRATGIPARLVVVAMTATDFSIADPNDPGMLDVVGFDTNTPQVISDFVAGRI